MSIKKINAAEFPAITSQKNKTVIVKFFAVWCGPCRQFAPVLEKFAAAHPEIEVCEMDIDPPENTRLIAELDINTVPTLMCFRNGEMISKISGFLNQRDLDKLEL